MVFLGGDSEINIGTGRIDASLEIVGGCCELTLASGGDGLAPALAAL